MSEFAPHLSVSLVVILSTIFVVSSCRLSGNALDLVLPDRMEIGTGITPYEWGSQSNPSGGGGGGGGGPEPESLRSLEEGRTEERGRGSMQHSWVSFSWDLPSVKQERDVSLTSMATAVRDDYRSVAAPPSNAIVSMTKDESGGYHFGIGTAFYSLLAALAGIFGWKMKGRNSDQEG